jgi:heat shock protein HslJ
MRHANQPWAVAAFVVLSLTSVVTTSSALAQDDAFPFADTELTLVSAAAGQVPAGITVTATFGSDGQVTGRAGCNDYFGPYTIDGEAISVGPLASTRMACEDAVMAVENAYLGALGSAATWAATSAALTLVTADGGELVYSADAGTTVPATGLTGVEWVLMSLDGTPIPDGVVATATFGEDGQVGGDASCNTYFGPYSVDGTSISIGPLASTLMLCEPSVMEIETPFLTALQAAASWSIEANELHLVDADGPQELVFTAGSSSVAGTSWRLRSIDGEAVAAEVTVTLKVEADGSLAGNAGCNDYFGSYETDGSSVVISDLGSTLISCEDPFGSVEARYLGALGAVSEWSIADDGALVLTGSGGELVFDPEAGIEASEPPAEATIAPSDGGTTAIVGPTWTLTSFLGLAVRGLEPATLVLSDDGTLSGDAGCNDYHGSYELTGDTITISDVGATRKICPGPMAMGLELGYLQALPAMTRWQVEGDELLLADETGSAVMTFSGG